MASAVKPSEQLRPKSCVASGDGPLRSVDREVVGRNDSEREHSPEIDRDRSSRPYPAKGKAESQPPLQRAAWKAPGVRTPSMQQKEATQKRETHPVRAQACRTCQAEEV